jgi:UDP-N-acetylmuramoyl-tripeptide--D-alanyl-D-alanine ligase
VAGQSLAAVFSAEEILEIVEGRLAVGMMHEDAGEICVDTRKLKEGQWFLALPGKHFDGHDFLGDAFSAGAIGCIVEERTNYAIASSSFPLLAVGDTEEAASRLARNWRRRLNPRLVLVVHSGVETGQVVGHFENTTNSPERKALVLRNAGWNDITSALLALDQETCAVIVELSATSVDEVKAVADLVAPNMVLLPPDSLSQLRIQASASEIAEAFTSLIKSLDRQHGIVAISDQLEIDLETRCSADQLGRSLIFGERDIIAGKGADQNTKELARCTQLSCNLKNEGSADQAGVKVLTALIANFLGLA